MYGEEKLHCAIAMSLQRISIAQNTTLVCCDIVIIIITISIILDNFDPVQFPQSSSRIIKHELPPPTGFGSEEDSLSSYYHLIPKPPRKDHAKFMEKDR